MLSTKMIDYTVMYKSELPIGTSWPPELQWDIFISAYTAAGRVRHLYDKIQAAQKHWLVFPEYGFKEAEYPKGSFSFTTRDEAAYIKDFWSSSVSNIAGKTIGVDI